MQNSKEALKAIVVDDEIIARKMIITSLNNEGFICYAASDGQDALNLLRTIEVDLVVTDLRMPNKHGHALAVELLEWPERPVIVVHTSVVDPRIVKDLMNRGVDDIITKPTDYVAFAAKMKVLSERRCKRLHSADDDDTQIQVEAQTDTSLAAAPQNEMGSQAAVAAERTTHEHLDKKPPKDVLHKPATETETPKATEHLLGIDALPLSPYVLEIYRMTSDDTVKTAEIADKIEREPSLMAELLRIGNSSFYNRSQQKTHSIENIIVKIGRRRLGQFALALHACSSLRSEVLPFLDIDLIWRRSLGAAIAVQLIIDKRGDADNDRGLVLSATMHLLGRVVLARTYPEDYLTIVETAKHKGDPLSVLEKRVFGASQSEQLAKLLGAWRIPSDVVDPLRHFENSYSDLAALGGTQRSDAETVKVAALIGWLAAGPWEPWDIVEFPSQKVAFQVSAFPIRQLVENTRRGLADLTGDHDSFSSASSKPATTKIRYVSAVDPDFDFFSQLLPALGLEPSRGSSLEVGSPYVLNCLGAKPDDLYRRFNTLASEDVFMLCEPENDSVLNRYGTPVVIPNTFGSIAQCFPRELPTHQGCAASQS